MTDRRPRILIVSFTHTAQEPRVLKQVSEFRREWHVTTAGYGPAPSGVDDHVELRQLPSASGLGRIPGIFTLLLLLHLYRLYVHLEPRGRDSFPLLEHGDWDLVVSHDAVTQHLASRLAPRCGVLADMHEYAPKQSPASLKWNLLYQPYFSWLCRTYVAKASAVTTVSKGIVDEYRREFGFDSSLVVNATPHHSLKAGPVGSPVRLVHSGGIAPQRRLDIMIRGVRESSADVTLDLYLVGGESLLMAQLKSLAEGDARIRFRQPVPYRELVRTLNSFDVGLSIFPPTTFNLAWCLPNKFFDFVQARLGVIVGPSPEMQRVVDEHGLGLVLPDFEPSSLASALESLSVEKVAAWKEAASRSARELAGEEQSRVWGRIVASMLGEE